MWSWSCVPFGFNKIMRLFSIAIQIGWVDVLDVEADVWSWAVQYIQKIMAIMAVKSNEDCFYSTYHTFILRALQLHHASNSSLRANLRATVYYLLFVILVLSTLAQCQFALKNYFVSASLFLIGNNQLTFKDKVILWFLVSLVREKKSTYRLWIC